jgi:hypothetical protein
MIRDNTGAAIDAIPFRALFLRACRGGLIFWSSNVATGLAMAWFGWPIYGVAVWPMVILFGPIFSVMGYSDLESVWQHWGWVIATLIWLPIIIAFRFAHLVAMHPQSVSPNSPPS